jgi:hypothetical protein
MLAIPLLLARPAFASDFEFGGMAFGSDLRQFLGALDNAWTYRGASRSQAFDACRTELEQLGLAGQPYISGCFFRNPQNPSFDGMYLYAVRKEVKRVLLNFRDDQTHDTVFRKLVADLGKPNLQGKYLEVRARHALIGWDKGTYRVIYDFGGVGRVRPVFLIFETLPLFPGNFNPPIVILDSLKKTLGARP